MSGKSHHKETGEHEKGVSEDVQEDIVITIIVRTIHTGHCWVCYVPFFELRLRSIRCIRGARPSDRSWSAPRTGAGIRVRRPPLFFFEEPIPDLAPELVRDLPDHLLLAGFVFGVVILRYIHPNRRPEPTIPDMIKRRFLPATQYIVRSKGGGGRRTARWYLRFPL